MKEIGWLKRITAAFLAVVLCTVQADAAVRTGGAGTAYAEKEHAEIPLDEMSRDLFHKEVFDSAVEELSGLADTVGREDRVRELYRIILEETDNLYTQYMLLTLDYYRDVEDPETAGRYQESGDLLMEAGNAAAETLRELLHSDGYGELLREEMGAEFAEAFAEYESVTPEESRLTEKEMDLVREYEEASLREYENSREENRVLGEIYLELVDVRTELARLQGYDNYADYAYESGYYRDYTVEDVEELRQEVKENLAPLFEECVDYALDQDVSGLYEAMPEDPEAMLDNLEDAMEEISPRVGEAYGYFRRMHLYDIDADDKKMDMGYTVELPAYGDAYIYNKGSGTYLDYFTMIHEFGHFTSVFYEKAPYLFTVVNMDVSEIHSQGLEVLFWPCYQEIVPDMGTAMQAYVVYEMLTNIISSCIYDEIEQTIYRDPHMSLEQLNREVEEISSQYGGLMTLDSYRWVEVNHLFQQPFYVISYATSALAALELLELSAENRQAALDRYMDISASGTGTPYCEVLENSGLSW